VFSEIFNVFSRRDPPRAGQNRKPLSREFRNRVVMLIRDQMQRSFAHFLEQLHNKVTYLHGQPRLSRSNSTANLADDLLEFLFACKDEQFLDVIELIFTMNYSGITWPDNPLIPAINQFFSVDDLPYQLTGYCMEDFETNFHGQIHTATRISEFPRIIRKNSEVIHKRAIEPALLLLRSTPFKHANSEFLGALEDYRKGDYQDCLTKCGSAFESTMKVLCHRKRIPFKQTDNASTLMKCLLTNSSLEAFWEQPLILIATLRNRLSSSHGAGTVPKAVPDHVAAYVINATASAIVFLADEFA